MTSTKHPGQPTTAIKNDAEIVTIRSEIFHRYPELLFAMSTRKGGVSPEPLGMNLSFHVGDERENVIKNRELFFGKMGVLSEDLTFTQQIHGDTVTLVQTPGQYEQCDALVTNRQGMYLTISVADCVPIFLFDPVAKAVAAVHAGWRGSKADIVTRALTTMHAAFASQAENVVAFIGPSAGVCCYEIGEDLLSQFDQQYIRKSPQGKTFLNLKSFNKDRLLTAGLREQHVEVSAYCTICTPEIFHSFRRDGAQSGRMLGVIGLKQV
jgi:YfiH family protein